MRISAQSTIGATERSLAEFHRNPNADLSLPSNLRHTAGGAEAALVQAVLTWARSSGRDLATSLNSEVLASNFVRRLPFLAAALCARSVHGQPHAQDLTDAVRYAALARLEVLQGVRAKEAFRGQSPEIVCADHLGRGAPYLLYMADPRGGSRLRPRENFRSLARWLIHIVVSSAYRREFDPAADEAIGAMLYEVFKNTEEHALTDERGDLLPVSIRAVTARHHGIEPHTLARIAGDYPPLSTYCQTLPPAPGAVQTHLFELSVVDTGPGFASRWTRQALSDLTLADEETAVRDCFGDGSTKGASRFGQGLPHVLRLLDRQRGFLRLRTGRLSFYADYSRPAAPESPMLRRHDPAVGGHWAAVAGSLLTLLIPMRR